MSENCICISKEISLIAFINGTADWRKILSQAPFYLTIRQDGEYILLKYSQYQSDMSYRITCESRGCIIKNNGNGEYKYVCRPFDKFFNYGEEFAAEIDWKTARVTEKVDGSLIKLWFDNGEWHLSTNGTINAFAAPAGENDNNFGDIFTRALGIDIQNLGFGLDKSRTYMFEMTSPETQVVISYPDGVYYLACRDTETGEEFFEPPAFVPEAKIKLPKKYFINKLEDVISTAKMMTKDEEGFVVNDAAGNRIKVKSPEYLVAAHMRMNGNITYKRIFKLIRNDQLDDFLAYAPNCKEKADKVLVAVNDLCCEMDRQWSELSGKEFKSQKEFAEEAKKSPLRGYFFLKQKNETLTAREFVFNISVRSIFPMLKIE